MNVYYLLLFGAFLLNAFPLKAQQSASLPAGRQSAGYIERIDPELNNLISKNARVEVLDTGFNWIEGPLWVASENMLLFSDIPENKIYKWTEQQGVSNYLSPAGYTGNKPRGGETGSNGLLLNEKGELLLCQHGDRRIARMEAPVNAPTAQFSSIADDYRGKKFNSPNDAVIVPGRGILFTDPPYGLEKGAKDPSRELDFQGVYFVKKEGEVLLLTDSISRPNGIALMPDGKTLIVANSDPEKAIWYTFELDESGSLSHPGILRNVTSETKNARGLPDGLKIDRKGNIFASGPGGIWIFNKEQRLLGKIRLPGVASNCALSDDEKSLFITADDRLLRVKMR